MLIYIIILIYLQAVVIQCTIDINERELAYIANRLTHQECRRLFTALQFTTYNLPAILNTAEELVPQDVACKTLLLRWNNGYKKWEGNGKSHIDVENRLRQLGRMDLADWLGITVFHKLAKDVYNIVDNAFTEDREEVSQKKLYEDKFGTVSDACTDVDYILWFVLIGLVLTAAYTFGNTIVISYKNRRKNGKIDDEEMELLSHVSLDSEQDSMHKRYIAKETSVFVKEVYSNR